MFKKFFIFFCSIILVACSQHESPNTIKVGTIAGPETQLMEVAKQVALKKYGLNIQIVQFSDYTMPNAALSEGSIDANMFQHVPYLDKSIAAHGYHLTAIGKTFIYPMGIYSDKIKSLENIQNKAIVAIPNDPSNEARALLLLQQAKLITLKPNSGVLATTLDILTNPHNLQFRELGAAELPRVLPDVTLAVINTNYAIPAGLHPSQALFHEDKDSPYANVVVVRTKDKDFKKYHELVKALQSKAVLEEAHQLFQDGAIPAWQVKNKNSP